MYPSAAYEFARRVWPLLQQRFDPVRGCPYLVVPGEYVNAEMGAKPAVHNTDADIDRPAQDVVALRHWF